MKNLIEEKAHGTETHEVEASNDHRVGSSIPSFSCPYVTMSLEKTPNAPDGQALLGGSLCV